LTATTASAHPAARGGDLCRACGLCCDGTFYNHVVIEADGLRHLPLVRKADETHLRLPCPAHRGDHCATYASRPQRCGNYHCRVLDRVEAGDLELDAAVDIVMQVKALAARVRAAWPEVAADEPLSSTFDALIARSRDEEWRRSHRDLLLDVAELGHLMRQRFGVRDGAKSL
jgi:hypothetical protein